MVVERIPCASLCSGIGGLDLGVRLAVPDARVVVYVEKEAFRAEVLETRMEEGALHPAPLLSDLADFDGRLWRDRICLLFGGYPCQPFSVAGNKRAEQDPRHLWPHFRRAMQQARPPWGFFENVNNHVRHGLETVLGDLAEDGFDAEWCCVRALDAGAPHKRDRLFILAKDRYCVDDPLSRRWHAELEDETLRAGWSALTASGGDVRTSNYGRALADAYLERLSQQRAKRHGAGQQRRLDADGCDSLVEYTEEQRERESHDQALAVAGCRQAGPLPGDGCDSVRPRRPVVHAAFELPDGEAVFGFEAAGRGEVAFAGIPSWPLLPVERDHWAALLRGDRGILCPAFEPALRGVAHGLAGGLEPGIDWSLRVSALGDSVIPLHASIALSLLLGRFFW